MANTIKPSAGNPIKVLNSSLEGITVTDDGDVQVKLGDDAGSKKLSIRDIGDVEVAYIDSDGVISGASGSLPTAVQGSVLIGDSTPEWALLDASTDTKILVGNGTTLASVALSGDVTMTNAGAVTIANDAVTLAKLANVTRGSLIVGGVSDAPTLLSGKTLGAILIGDGTDITSTVNPSIAGNVGIGGTLTVSNSASTCISLTSSDAGYGRIWVNTSDAAADSQLSFASNSSTKWTIGNDATDNSFNIMQGFGVFASPKVTVLSSGNVGIGTSSPTSALVVQKGSMGTPFTALSVLSGGATDYTGIGLGRVTEDVLIGVAGANNHYVNGSEAGDTVITTLTGRLLFGRNGPGGSLSAMIDSSGNVGIGETTIPTGAKLAVGGGIAVTNGAGTPTLILDDNIVSTVTTTTHNERITVSSAKTASVNSGAYFSAYGNDHATYAGAIAIIAGNESTGDITFYTGGGVVRLTIKQSGAIIIGTLPTSDPEVSGQLWNSSDTVKISAG